MRNPLIDLRPILLETPVAIDSIQEKEIGLTFVQLRLHDLNDDGSYRILHQEIASN
jgi:hypothetical protein